MKRNKFLYIITIIYSILWIGYVIYYLCEQGIIIEDNQTQINNSKTDSFTWNTFDPSYIWFIDIDSTTQTWTISPESNTGSNNEGSADNNLILSDIDRMTSFKEKWYYRIYNPPEQPKVTGTYEEKSAILNNFITKHNFYFTTTSKLTEWYILIRTDKPLWKNEDIFLYFHNTNLNWYPVSWKISKNSALWNPEKWEYLYKIDDLPIFRYYDKKLMNYNWLENELINTKKIHFIAGYITTSSWNSIKEIIIAWQ